MPWRCWISPGTERTRPRGFSGVNLRLHGVSSKRTGRSGDVCEKKRRSIVMFCHARVTSLFRTGRTANRGVIVRSPTNLILTLRKAYLG